MNILAIDTSTQNLSLAIAKDEQILAYRNEDLGRKMSNAIVPRIERLLTQVKIKPAEIDGFVVGLGPGSFTSLRVGLSTIKGLAFVGNKPIVGIPSLDAVARSIKKSEHPVCVVADAKRSLVYTSCYTVSDDKITRTSEYVLTDIVSFLDQLSTPVIFIGDAVALYEKEIKKSKKAIQMITDSKQVLPQAKYFIHEGFRRLKAGKIDSMAKIVPLYLYKEDCQVQAKS
ncbi:MAG: tRNA (adenosine(37)-N6)-threonylcarbamoyltransferase complex dimerization subunit type 1 TsaB [Candidatus Omnitrophica bacterium]|nr:tRNA (adenosine(37)-N6)-threonylcarbamoyltransferase complex dimerization subunit type 1 TsaB [Candidatus Omnitrophota bacterium]